MDKEYYTSIVRKVLVRIKLFKTLKIHKLYGIFEEKIRRF